MSKLLDVQRCIDAIALFLDARPFATVRDVQRMILETFDVSASNELVRLAVRRAGFTRKRARMYSETATQQNKVQAFLQQRDAFLRDGRPLVFVDETSFGRNYHPSIGYAKKGNRLRVRRRTAHVTTVSVVAAVDRNRLYAFTSHPGSINTDRYVTFLRTLQIPDRSVLVHDNVSFHHSAAVRMLADERGWALLFTPPYSPQYNAIEGAFSVVKRHYQQQCTIEESFNRLTTDQLNGFYRGALSGSNR